MFTNDYFVTTESTLHYNLNELIKQKDLMRRHESSKFNFMLLIWFTMTLISVDFWCNKKFPSRNFRLNFFKEPDNRIEQKMMSLFFDEQFLLHSFQTKKNEIINIRFLIVQVVTQIFNLCAPMKVLLFLIFLIYCLTLRTGGKSLPINLRNFYVKFLLFQSPRFP